MVVAVSKIVFQFFFSILHTNPIGVLINYINLILPNNNSLTWTKRIFLLKSYNKHRISVQYFRVPPLSCSILHTISLENKNKYIYINIYIYQEKLCNKLDSLKYETQIHRCPTSIFSTAVISDYTYNLLVQKHNPPSHNSSCPHTVENYDEALDAI